MTRPNFVVIMTDTQATNVLGAYGHPECRTPSIDRLADASVTFERAYTTSPLCTPARAGLFTGRYSHIAGPWANGLALGRNIRHMGQRFRDSQYHAAYVGKWHLDGHDYFGTGSCPDGWDDRYWYDGRRYLESLTEEERRLQRSGLRSPEALRAADIKAEFTWGHRVSNRAIEFLRRPSEEASVPFLLVVSYDEPHDPFTCPFEYVEPFLEYLHPLGPAAFDDLSMKPVYQQNWAAAPFRSEGNSAPDMAPVMARHRERGKVRGYAYDPMYFGCNSFIDSEIGRVVQAVDQYAPDNTYIIYTSDHGEMLGSHGLWEKGPAVYEEIAHIPLVIRPPASRQDRKEGKRVSTVVSHIDVLPTMLELAGMDIPRALEGESLVPLLSGETEDDSRAAFLEFHRFELPHDEMGGFYPMRAIIKWPYKVSINLLDTDELYDLTDDSAEVVNRINDPEYAAVRDELHDELLDWMHEILDPFRAPLWEQRPWRSTRRFTWESEWPGRRRGWSDGYPPDRIDYSTGLPA